LEAWQGLRAWPMLERDGVADGRAVDLLDARHHEAHIPGGQLAQSDRLRHEAAELVRGMAATGGHDAELLTGLEAAVHDPHQRDDAHVIVEPRVDDQRL